MRNTLTVPLIALCIAIAILAVAFGLKVLLFPVHTIVQSTDTAYGVVDEVLDPEKAVADYEWFKEQEAHIRVCLKNEEIAKKEYDAFLATLPDDRTVWSADDNQEEASLRNSYYALQKLTNLAMEQYNARASMVSRNIFKDNLPTNISRAWYSGLKLMSE